MKKIFLFLVILILTSNLYSQITFEKGYYINNSGQKNDCLIKNNDWRNNPIDFKYKISENDKVKTISIKEVKEFGIYGVSKYIMDVVKIDISSNNINSLGYTKEPIFKKEQFFLKVLVEGKANLYLYKDGNIFKYFYSVENSSIKQLVYKRYKTSDGKIRINNKFKLQLWNDLKCSSIKMENVKKLEYKNNSLVNFFCQYNKCSNSNFINYNNKQKRDLFNLTLRPRINNSSLSIHNDADASKDTDYGNKLGFSFGIETEYILPFNKNKWGVLIEPTYQHFKAENTFSVDYVQGGKLTSEVKYNSIEIPISLRYYFFLNKKSKIYIDASYIYDIKINSSILFKRADDSYFSFLYIDPRNNYAFGLGYKLNNKYDLEVRYQTNREILSMYSFWKSDYKTLSLILGYSIF